MTKTKIINENNKRLLEATFSALNSLSYYQRDEHESDNYQNPIKEGSYPFIPTASQSLFASLLALTYVIHETKIEDAPEYTKRILKVWNENIGKETLFLDVGCGVGNVLVAANAFGMCKYYHGIEYFHDTYEKAVNWLGINRNKTSKYEIFKENILDFDRYNDYNIIYYFRPFENPKLQEKLESIIENQMKVGAILIPRWKKRFIEIQRDERFVSVFEYAPDIEPMYIKVSN